MTFNKATISFGEFAVFSGFLVDNCYLYDIFILKLHDTNTASPETKYVSLDIK